MTDDLDGRLGRVLHELASDAPTGGVFERVASKRRRRQSARRVRTAALGVVAVIAVVGAAVWVGRDDRTSTVATRGSATSVRVARGVPPPDDVKTAGRAVPLRTVPVRPDEEYVTSPVLATGTTIASASYERSGGGYTFPPSHVVRVRADGRVVDRVDLQGEILDLADGEGARWALTHDKEVIGPQDPEFRIKRIGPDGTVVSNPVPPGDVPTGDLVAAGGGVWLPVRDAVLRFDPVTGALAARVPLSVPTDHRGIASLGKFVAVTDGTAVRRLDPSTDTASDPAVDPLLGIGTPGVAGLVGLGGAAETTVVLAERTGGSFELYALPSEGRQRRRLPGDLRSARLQSANGVTWIEGQRQGAAVAMVLEQGQASVARSLTLARGKDVDFTFLDRTRAVLVADGGLHRTRVR
jgi:hypothetical protein